MPYNEQDALDQLYSAVARLLDNQCDLAYIQGEVEDAYAQHAAAMKLAEKDKG